MTYHGRAVETPKIVARIAMILRTHWDPNGALRSAASATDAFYDDQATIVAGMLSAAARDVDIQRYLRQLEQQHLSRTLHPAEARHAIAVTLWQAARADEGSSAL